MTSYREVPDQNLLILIADHHFNAGHGPEGMLKAPSRRKLLSVSNAESLYMPSSYSYNRHLPKRNSAGESPPSNSWRPDLDSQPPERTLKERLGERALRAIDASSSYISSAGSSRPATQRRISGSSFTPSSPRYLSSSPTTNSRSPTSAKKRSSAYLSRLSNTLSGSTPLPGSCSCLPGWAVIREQKDGEHNLHVEVHGYAYSPRTLNQASRSQRMLIRLAKQLASVPSISSVTRNAVSAPNSDTEEEPISYFNQDWLPPSSKSSSKSGQDLNKAESSRSQRPQQKQMNDTPKLTNEPLSLDDPSIKYINETQDPAASLTDETYSRIVALSQADSISYDDNGVSYHFEPKGGRSFTEMGDMEDRDQLSFFSPSYALEESGVREDDKPRGRTSWARTPPPKHPMLQNRSRKPRPQRSRSSSSQRDASRRKTKTLGPLKQASTSRSDMNPVLRMHQNFEERLGNFFSVKLDNRRVNVRVFEEFDDGSAGKSPIASTILTTTEGGMFSHEFILPLKNFSAKQPKSVRIVVSLFPPNPPASQRPFDPAVSRNRPKTSPAQKMSAQDHDREYPSKGPEKTQDLLVTTRKRQVVSVSVTRPEVPRVISDIDDTIKRTDVTEGMRAVLKNVFAAEYTDTQIQGMSQWFRAMRSQGAAFHFVSNAPMELCETLKSYLLADEFPSGSLRLKQYSQGGSFFSGLWESASDRKRPGVEHILQNFPESNFILVGDSGEQDLELYADMARKYPTRVRAVFIRDVTTPIINTAYSDRLVATPQPVPPSRTSSQGSTGEETFTSTRHPGKRSNNGLNDMTDGVGLLRVDEEPNEIYQAPDSPSRFPESQSKRPPLGSRTTSAKSGVFKPVTQPMNRKSASLPIPNFKSPSGSDVPPRDSQVSNGERKETRPSLLSLKEAGSSLSSDSASRRTSSINTTRPGSTASTTFSADSKRKAVESFYARVAEAERIMPAQVVLRIFRNGDECIDEGIELIRHMHVEAKK